MARGAKSSEQGKRAKREAQTRSQREVGIGVH